MPDHSPDRQKLARITLDSMTHFVGLLDADGTVIEINKVTLDAAGIPLQQVEGKPLWSTLWWQASAEINAILRDALRRASQGDLVHWETPIHRRSDSAETITIDASLTPVKDDAGKVVFIAVEGRDITEKKSQEREIARLRAEAAQTLSERKELEASLRHADRRKDEFLATLAHELRNPLAPIRNAVHLLKASNPSDPTIRSARDIVDRQVRHMVRLVDDLMDVSRITLGQINLRDDRIHLRSVLTDAIEAVAPFVESRKHALSVHLPAQLLTTRGDATRLSQIFQNLLNNAAKYTPEGGQIWLTAAREGHEIVVRVRDNGVGIAKDQQERVFELFTRADPGDRIKTAGLGIGLSLARQLIELHRGRIELESAGPGHGSEFRVYMPVWDEPSGSTQENLTEEMTVSGGTRQRVLIADDNCDAADSLALLLRREGYAVRTAADGGEALKIAEEFIPDIVLLDIGMPVLNGYEVAERIRASLSCRHALIVALTGWGQPEDRRQAQKAGFDEHLTKPVDPNLLATLLAAAVRSPVN